MCKDRFGALAVGLPAEDTAAERRAHGDRRDIFRRRTIAQPRRLGDQLVEPRVDIVRELDFRHRAQPIGPHPHRRGDDPAFGDRRVEDAGLAVFLLQPCSAAEHSAEIADILAHHHDIGIASHGDIERLVDRFDHVEAAFGRAFALASAAGFGFGRAHFGSPSGNLISRSLIACSACSLRCQGSSSNTSSNMVRKG